MAEITNRDEFKVWLKGQPKEWSQVLAARTALRVLPSGSRVFDVKSLKPSDQRQLIFSIFRATSISWVVRKYPTRNMLAAGAAAFVAHAAAADAAFVIHSAAGAAIPSHALAIADLAVADAAAAAAFVAQAAATAAAHDAAAHAASAASVHAATPVDIWVAIDADEEFLQGADGDKEAAAERLAGKGLWLNRSGAISTPKWCLDALDRLEHQLLELDDNWQVWTQWYRPLLQGQPGWGLSAKNAEDLIVRITTQDKKFWDAGASEVNAKIAAWLIEFGTVETILQDELVTVTTEFPSEFDLERTVLTPNPINALQKIHVNHDQLLLTVALLKIEVDSFKEKLRGSNALDPELKEELTTLLERHVNAAENMIAAAEEQPDGAGEIDENKFKEWFDRYLASVKDEFPKYTDPEKFGKATIPATVVGLSFLVGTLAGMPMTFGFTAMNLMGMSPLVKAAKEILKKKGSEE